MTYILRQANIVIGDVPRVERGDIVIEQDRIAFAGPSPAPEIFAGTVIDCADILVTPGFINAHIHPNQLLNRGFLENVGTDALLAGMHSRHEWKSDDDRYWASLLSISEGLRSGTTYFAAFVGDAGRIGEALRDAGVRGTVTVAPKDQWVGHGTAEIRETARVLDRLRTHMEQPASPRVTSSIGAVSEKGASADLLRGITRIASETSARVFMHVAEGKSAVEASLRLHGATSINFLHSIGFLTTSVCLVHAAWITACEAALIAQSGASICHCPISNAKTAAGVLPFRDVAAAGVNLALGTDAASSGNTNNLLVEGYFCALLHRAKNEDGTLPTAGDIYRMLTTGGAEAVGMSGEIGRIKVGFKADLSLWDLRQSAFLPNVADPITSLIFAAPEIRPSLVFVDGELVFHERPLKFDADAAHAHVRTYGERCF